MSWTKKIWGGGILKFVGVIDPTDPTGASAMPLSGIAGDDGKEVLGAAGVAAYAGEDIAAAKPSLYALIAGIFFGVSARAPAALIATIADADSLSAAIELGGKLPCGFYIPASFEGGYIEFQRSLTGTEGDFYDVVDDYSGAKLRVAAPASCFVRLSNPAEWVGVGFLKIRSVTSSGVAAAQVGAASIIVPVQG